MPLKLRERALTHESGLTQESGFSRGHRGQVDFRFRQTCSVVYRKSEKHAPVVKKFSFEPQSAAGKKSPSQELGKSVCFFNTDRLEKFLTENSIFFFVGVAGSATPKRQGAFRSRSRSISQERNEPSRPATSIESFESGLSERQRLLKD